MLMLSGLITGVLSTTCKPGRLRWNATFCGVSSVSALFAEPKLNFRDRIKILFWYYSQWPLTIHMFNGPLEEVDLSEFFITLLFHENMQQNITYNFICNILTIIIWASMRENLSSGVWKQHRRRPACASAQSDQRLCYWLVGKYRMKFLRVKFQFSS